MPAYTFRCPTCRARQDVIAPIRSGPPSIVACMNDGTMMLRDYRADRPHIAPVLQSTYSPSLGREVSDQRQVDDAMKQITEDSFNRTGYVPDLVAMHRSEIQHAGASNADPAGQAQENALRAIRDGAARRGTPTDASTDM